MHASLLTLAVAVTIAAPVPKGLDKSKLYYPTTLGTKWVYQYGRSGEEQAEVITNVVRQADEVVVTIEGEETNGKRTPLRTMALRADGLYMLDEVGKAYDPPVRVLKLPVKVGDRWEVDTKRADVGRIRFADEVKQVAKIDTPAGTFEAVEIESECRIGLAGSASKYSHWYAPEVGLVRIGAIRELKSFTPGKDEKAEPKKDK